MLKNIEKKKLEQDQEYNKLSDYFHLNIKNEYFIMNETEIKKMIQKRRKSFLKDQLNNFINIKINLKQEIKKREKEIKVNYNVGHIKRIRKL